MSHLTLNPCILITGASGFVGHHACNSFVKNGHNVIALTRRENFPLTHPNLKVSQLSANTDWQALLKDVHIILHLAGRAHVMHDEADDIYHAYKQVNVEATQALATEAVKAGVKRFIYISSIKVNGEQTFHQPYTAFDDVHPEDDYGKTKFEAEQVLSLVASGTGMEVVIIRPPLIYGAGVKANVLNLIKICQQPLPLPFGAIHNKRSMVYIENLVDFMLLCTMHPKAANETFLISDDEDVSITTLVSTIRQALGRPRWLLPIPASALHFFCKLIGKPSLAVRLCGNLQVDISKTKQLLDWKPPFTFKQGMEKTVQSYLGTKHHD